MTKPEEIGVVKARLGSEMESLRERIAKATDRLQCIALAAERGDKVAVRERNSLHAERLAANQRLEEVTSAIASADALTRDAEDAALRVQRETARGEVARLQEQRLSLAARLDAAFEELDAAWRELAAANGELNAWSSRAGLPPSAGRRDVSWLMRAFWKLAPEIARQVRLAPQLRTCGQPFAASVAGSEATA
ncbi:MAG: hypothetical protein KDC98_12925 [Planctomycetes bacterium]|nr:hypothetical protein [Planctomycetota bacterium]